MTRANLNIATLACAPITDGGACERFAPVAKIASGAVQFQIGRKALLT
jgi:hypothetical protein